MRHDRGLGIARRLRHALVRRSAGRDRARRPAPHGQSVSCSVTFQHNAAGFSARSHWLADNGLERGMDEKVIYSTVDDQNEPRVNSFRNSTCPSSIESLRPAPQCVTRGLIPTTIRLAEPTSCAGSRCNPTTWSVRARSRRSVAGARMRWRPLGN
jgi:hypothetical protein